MAQTICLSNISLGKRPIEALNWCFKTFGPMGTRWKVRELKYIDFTKERDATLFLLHWG